MAPARRAGRPGLLLLLSPSALGLALSRDESQAGGGDIQPQGDSKVDAFDAYIRKHNRAYRPGSEEYGRRLALFQLRQAEAERQNRPGSLWTFDAANAFADRSEEERARLLAWRRPAGGDAAARQPLSLLDATARNVEAVEPTAVPAADKRSAGFAMDTTDKVGEHSAAALESGLRISKSLGRKALVVRGSRAGCGAPAAWTWGDLNFTRRVRSQGSCGSCSALAVASALEAHSEIHRAGPARTFAAQELISCVPNPEACGGEGGCRGGFMELHLSYAVRHGLHREEDYPPTSHDTSETGQCRAQAELDKGFVDTQPGVYEAAPGAPGRGLGLVGYERLPKNREEPLVRALLQRGPVVVALAAHNFFGYGSGIFDGCQKDPVVDHAMVLLGFGEQLVESDGEGVRRKYWHLLNSWGPEWGLDGKMMLQRRDGEQEICGTDAKPELGAACSNRRDGTRLPQPLEPVTVCGTCGLLFNPVVPHFEGDSLTSLRLKAQRTSCPSKAEEAPRVYPASLAEAPTS